MTAFLVFLFLLLLFRITNRKSSVFMKGLLSFYSVFALLCIASVFADDKCKSYTTCEECAAVSGCVWVNDLDCKHKCVAEIT